MWFLSLRNLILLILKEWCRMQNTLPLCCDVNLIFFLFPDDCRYVKYPYPYECVKLSDPQELQMAIDSNKRDRRHSENMDFMAPQLQRGEMDPILSQATPLSNHSHTSSEDREDVQSHSSGESLAPPAKCPTPQHIHLNGKTENSVAKSETGGGITVTALPHAHPAGAGMVLSQQQQRGSISTPHTARNLLHIAHHPSIPGLIIPQPLAPAPPMPHNGEEKKDRNGATAHPNPPTNNPVAVKMPFANISGWAEILTLISLGWLCCLLYFPTDSASHTDFDSYQLVTSTFTYHHPYQSIHSYHCSRV